MAFAPLHDTRVRKATFDWLTQQVSRHGDVLPWKVLSDGFQFDGVRVPLVGPQGIFKPRVLEEVPLSITTVYGGPYDDSFGSEGLLRYRYRGTDPNHADNRGLRAAMQRRLPLVYLHGVAEGKYLAAWPVFVVADNPGAYTFTVAVDDVRHPGLADDAQAPLSTGDEAEFARRAYSTAVVRVRLHQRAFRERVLDAYQHQCAFCRLRHQELLDAAHLIPDANPEGDPLVTNGVALCALHHAAFDKYFIGIRPDYVIEIRPDLLDETDGPTLKHAIQGLHLKPLTLPRRRENRPEVRCLEMRYELFQRAAESRG
ncbi:MAG TPA: HNH endonuclease [Usitatibacter sp.]|nr:HNH endonuclease [Usitatibacter sp.]